MATWALSASKQTEFGDQRVVEGLLTATGTYTAGGDTIAPGIFGLDVIDYIDISGVVVSASTALLGIIPTALPTAGNIKIQLFGDSGGAAGSAFSEASGTITGFTCTVEVRGV